MNKAIIEKARSLADSEDYYEMDACGHSYEDCPSEGCIRNILLRAAKGALLGQAIRNKCAEIADKHDMPQRAW